MDPIAVRRKNCVGANTNTINGLRVTSNGFLECLAAVETASGWREKFRRLPYGRGVGVAGSMYITGTNYCIYPNEMPQAAVQLKLDRSGRATVFCGCSDIGQGVDSVLAYIVCEELGLELRDVRVVAADTDLTPVDLGSYSSRETFMAGNACLDAARTLRGRVAEAVAAAAKSGLSLRKLYEVISAGGVNSGIFRMMVGSMLEGDLAGLKFAIANAQKHLRYFTHLS